MKIFYPEVLERLRKMVTFVRPEIVLLKRWEVSVNNYFAGKSILGFLKSPDSLDANKH